MAEESQNSSAGVIRGINWRETFPFTNIFRAFRIAIHPSKLGLGLIALLILYTGGRLMDLVWAKGSMANWNEATYYQIVTTAPPENAEFARDREDFGRAIRERRQSNRDAYRRQLESRKILTDPKVLDEAAASFDRVSEVKTSIQTTWQKGQDDAYAAFLTATKAAEAEQDAKKKADMLKAADVSYAEKRAEVDRRAIGEFRQLDRTLPRGIFEEFFSYQVSQINAAAKAVTENRWFEREETEPGARGERGTTRTTPGAIGHVTNLLRVGPVWLWKYHPLYAAIYTILFLLVWAVFGGAISRIAAVQVARDEGISVRQALQFSINKVLSFAFAPLIPLGIVLVLGALVAVGGLLFYVPVIGPIVGGGLLVLALIAGVIITLVLFGTVGGLNLMFPTIAVEGSDSFDAISRSFSYVFSRPWRMLFYSAVALVYFAVTYLFVRYFVYIVLGVTHYFTTLLLTHRPAYYFQWMWPTPDDVWELPYTLNLSRLAWSEQVAAIFMAAWNFLFIGLVGAFAISFYLTVNTIIYTLMRREVDATELEDVYVEEAEDDFVDAAPVAAAPAAVATPAPAPAASPSFSPPTIVGETSQYTPPSEPPKQ